MIVRSGAQTGVDLALLDVALELGIPCGGWVPLGRKNEAGAIPAHYPVRETPSEKYAVRTEWNVRDSDATLLLAAGDREMGRGSLLTLTLCRMQRKPCKVVYLRDNGNHEPSADYVRGWLDTVKPEVLNVAGPRESSVPGIHDRAAAFLREVLR